MSECEKYRQLISAALDGVLSPQEAAELKIHLDQCPDCQALSEELASVRAALADLPRVEPPEGLTERIMFAVAADQVIPAAPKTSHRQWRRWAACAAVLAVIFTGASIPALMDSSSKSPAAAEVGIDDREAIAAEAAPYSFSSDTTSGDATSNTATGNFSSTKQAEPSIPVAFAKTDAGKASDTVNSPEERSSTADLQGSTASSHPFISLNGLGGNTDPSFAPLSSQESERQAMALYAQALFPEEDLGSAVYDPDALTLQLSLSDGSAAVLCCGPATEDGYFPVTCLWNDTSASALVDLATESVINTTAEE